MSSITCTRPRVKSTRVKPERKIRLLARLASGAGIFQVAEGKTTDRYFFAPLPSDFGLAFTVEKWADATEETPAGIVQTYHVCLDGKASMCECKGFLRWSHCRHLEGLSALLEAGKVETAPAPCRHENVAQSEDGEIVCHDCGCEL